ncbi:MAG: DUF547 domain-containing protein [Acidobacteriota bacterium]
MRSALIACLLVLCVSLPSVAQDVQADAARRKSYDEMLDLNVRDGLVYYRALRAGRGPLDAYVASLAAAASLASASREEQMAFWLNAYNAIVLKTVVDHYPIPQRSSEYPARSIRQIPGAFERTAHRVAGRMVTLDQIEQTILAEFHDPRLYLALGRGAIGGGRLRSEAYSGAGLEAQLKDAVAECVTRAQCIEIDRANSQISISPIFSWRSAEFIAAYASTTPELFATRSPVERALLAFIQPHLLTTEREFLEKNQFKIAFKPFDWSLNDLTGRGGR